MGNLVDIGGVVFGRLTAIECVGRKWGKALWRCRCTCGREVEINSNSLRTGSTTSCGCGHVTHGHTHKDERGTGLGTRTYHSWTSMKKRCTAPTAPDYHLYGGRGITVCERWLVFADFLADMGERPDGKTLDRFPNRDGNYEPGNCRWATPHEQNVNRGVTKLTEATVQELHGRIEHGESAKSVAHRLGVTTKTVYSIRRGEKWKGSINGYPENRINA